MVRNIYVRLLKEGTVCYRAVKAAEVENGKYQIIGMDNYDTDIEEWEFSPGTIVHVQQHMFSDNSEGLLAISSDTKMPD